MTEVDWLLVIGGIGAALAIYALVLFDYLTVHSNTMHILRRVLKSLFSSPLGDERASELAIFGPLQSSQLKEVEALQELVSALNQNANDAVVDVGSFIFIKTKNSAGEPQIFSKRLTVFERAQLNENPSLLEDPKTLLQLLGEVGLSSLDLAEEVKSVRAILSTLSTGSKEGANK